LIHQLTCWSSTASRFPRTIQEVTLNLSRNGYSLFFCRRGNTKGDGDGVEAVVERVFISTWNWKGDFSTELLWPRKEPSYSRFAVSIYFRVLILNRWISLFLSFTARWFVVMFLSFPRHFTLSVACFFLPGCFQECSTNVPEKWCKWTYEWGACWSLWLVWFLNVFCMKIY
jgi:hypothetical protein